MRTSSRSSSSPPGAAAASTWASQSGSQPLRHPASRSPGRKPLQVSSRSWPAASRGPTSGRGGSGGSALHRREAIPVVVEPLGHRPEVGRRHAELQGQGQRPLQLGAVQQLGVEGLEPLVEVEVRSDLVEHRDRGGSPASTGKAVRMRCAKACRVQKAAWSRSSSAMVNLALRSGPRWPRSPIGPQGQPDALTELVSGLLGEGDGGDRLDGNAGVDQRDHPLHQLGRLA